MLPEQRLIVSACRSAVSGDALDVQPRIAEPSRAICLADDLGVLGLVSDYLRGVPDIDPLWEAAWRANAARNLMLVSEIARWYAGLRSAGVRPILLKGPALAKLAFGSIARRDSCDIDLIVPVAQFRTAVDACVNLGAVPTSDFVFPNDHDALGALTFTVPQCANTYAIDLHAGWIPTWGRVQDRTISDEDLCDVQLTGSSFQTLGPELTLLQEAAHFWQHGFSLKTLMDVCAALAWARRLGVFERIAWRARRMGVARGFLYATDAADQFSVSGTVPSIPRWWRVLGRNARHTPGGTGRMSWLWRECYVERSLPERAKLLLSTIWPRRAVLMMKPEWIGARHLLLRRFLRPIRLSTTVVARLTLHRRGSWRNRPPLRFRHQ